MVRSFTLAVLLLTFVSAVFVSKVEAQILAPTGHTRGVIISVRPDPLSAYADLEAQFYPFDIPVSERGVALQTLRAARFQQAVPNAIVDPVVGPDVFMTPRRSSAPPVLVPVHPPTFAPGFVPTLSGRVLSPLGTRSSLVPRLLP